MTGKQPPMMKPLRKTRRFLREGGQPSQKKIILKAPAQDPRRVYASVQVRYGTCVGPFIPHRRAAPGGPLMYLMMHKFTIFQSPYIYLYLLKFFSFLFILHKTKEEEE
jgi:hypothetical protein